VSAFRAEIAKITTVRLWWVLLLILVGYVVFFAALLAAIFGAFADQLAATGGNVPIVADADLPGIIYSSAVTFGYVVPVLFGALVTTAEARHQTLTPTFLANPHRGRVLAAKAAAVGLFGVIFGLAALGAAVIAGGGMLAIGGVDLGLGEPATWALLGRAVLAMVLWAIIGVGLGVLVPSQVAAIVIVLAFTQFVEPILRAGASVWEWSAQIGQFLPGAASDALVGASIFTSLGQGTTPTATLEWWQGGLVLLGIAAAASVGGFFTSWRHDVT
jgi:ABC-2 type transport system permease protein